MIILIKFVIVIVPFCNRIPAISYQQEVCWVKAKYKSRPSWYFTHMLTSSDNNTICSAVLLHLPATNLSIQRKILCPWWVFQYYRLMRSIDPRLQTTSCNKGQSVNDTITLLIFKGGCVLLAPVFVAHVWQWAMSFYSMTHQFNHDSSLIAPDCQSVLWTSELTSWWTPSLTHTTQMIKNHTKNGKLFQRV